MHALLLVLSGAAALDSEPRREREVIAAEIQKEETGLEADHATGDWAGLRQILVDSGIHLHAGYAGEVMGNVSGGSSRGAVYAGLLEMSLELDTSKLRAWENGFFRISSLFPHGSNISGKHVGDLLAASNMDAYESFRLYELWYEHHFLNGQFSARAGQMAADDEFAFTEAGGHFLNSAFGWPAFISANVLNTGPAYFVAAPGLHLRYEPVPSFYLQAGVFDGDSFDSPAGDPSVNSAGTRIHLDREQGAFSLLEAGFSWSQDRLPGIAKAGAWLHTADFDSNFSDANGQPIALTGLPPQQPSPAYGVYAAAEQTVWRESEDQGVALFARAGLAPRDRSFFEFAADLGFAWTGLIPARDKDVFGLGFVHARISRDIRDFERLDAALNGADYPAYSDYESVLEAFYSIKLKNWWTLQPDFQWIIHPGGRASVSDALVLGVRTSIVF